MLMRILYIPYHASFYAYIGLRSHLDIYDKTIGQTDSRRYWGVLIN